MKRTAVRWMPALAWAALIFFLSSRSRLPEPPGIFGWDKLQHTVGYAVGGFLLARAAGVRGRWPLLALALGVLYGASDEAHQAFVPGRSSDVRDWMADSLGVLVGVYIYRSFHLRRGRGGETAAPPAAEPSVP